MTVDSFWEEGSPCLSLWERWPSAARTERVCVEDFNGRSHSKNTAGPSQSRLRRASSPRGRAKGAFSMCFPSAPIVPTMGNAAAPVLRLPRLKTPTNQRNRRERPMCRSARERTELLPIKTIHVPAMSFRPQRKRSGGIHYVAKRNYHKIKLATREDSSAHCVSLGMTSSVGGSVLSARVIFATQRNGT